MKTLVWTVAFAAVVAGAWFGIDRLRAEDAAGDGSVLTAEVESGDLPLEVELNGIFVADDKDEIRMEPKSYRGDLIITTLVAEGRSVKKGETLIEFDQSNLEDSLEDAKDDVKGKEIALAKAEADKQSWEIDETGKQARRDLDANKAKRELEKAREKAAMILAEKEKAVADAEQRFKDGEIDLQQLLQLYEERELHTSTENILIERERRRLDNTKKSLVKSRREFALWKKYDQEQDILEKELDLKDKEAEIKKAKAKVEAERGEKGAAVSKAKRALKKAQKKVKELDGDAKTLKVVSPRDGIIFYGALASSGGFSDVIILGMGASNKEMKVGGRVRTFQVLMTVASMDRLSVRMKALEGDIQHLTSGLPVVVRPDAFPALAIDGELTKVDQVASRSGFLSDVREFTVHGTYDGSFPQLRSGMNCRVTVRANSVPDCLQIPVLAVFSEGDSHFCWVIDGDKRTKREVTIGTSNGSKVEVKEGLRAGETVALYDPSSV
ncbi:MAG: hypothetical protein CMJ83_01400 [Planctomycetes bacterium]|nr:hypothetical protein [Planctomycetota bacterium]